MSRPGVAVDGARRQVAVARWLEAVDYPATRALDGDQPVEADGRVVTFWHSATDVEEYAPLDEVGYLLRDLHALESRPDVELPEVRPFGEDWEPLPDYPGLAQRTRSSCATGTSGPGSRSTRCRTSSSPESFTATRTWATCCSIATANRCSSTSTAWRPARASGT